jgi:hypothetical protein
LALFGPPLLLEGEDRAAYEELVTRFFEAVMPVDVVDDMLVADVVSGQWEVLRQRRFKWNRIRKRGLDALEGWLCENLNYDLCKERYVELLAEDLQNHLPEDEAEDLAQACARNEPDAVDRAREILFIPRLDHVLQDAKADRAEEIVQAYARSEPNAVKLVDKLLARAGTSMDALTADAFAKDLDAIERIDRLITFAESRRNASLREIDRRRAVLGERLRRSVQQIEDSELRLIETAPAKGKDAA